MLCYVIVTLFWTRMDINILVHFWCPIAATIRHNVSGRIVYPSSNAYEYFTNINFFIHRIIFLWNK